MLPETRSLELSHDARGVLHVTLAREHLYNAVNAAMLSELTAVFGAIHAMDDVRVVVLRGKGGHFSSGGDLGELTAAITARGDGADDALADMIRDSGRLLSLIDRSPKLVISVLEGVVLGTGLGMACVSDMVIAHAGAELSLPEVTIGFPPSQIAPFLLRRIGVSGTRMLALTARRFDGREAHRLGLAHVVTDDVGQLPDLVEQVVGDALRCGPAAVAATKDMLRDLEPGDLERFLDGAARRFVEELRREEGAEGVAAFLARRAPGWSPQASGEVRRKRHG